MNYPRVCKNEHGNLLFLLNSCCTSSEGTARLKDLRNDRNSGERKPRPYGGSPTLSHLARTRKCFYKCEKSRNTVPPIISNNFHDDDRMNISGKLRYLHESHQPLFWSLAKLLRCNGRLKFSRDRDSEVKVGSGSQPVSARLWRKSSL